MTSTPRRLLLTLTVTALMLTGLTAVTAVQAPAQAASVCSTMSTGAVGVRYNGIIRLSDHGHIRWSMRDGEGCPVVFPLGGSLWVRVLKLQNTSGGGCNSTVVGYYSWVNYTGYQSKLLASIGSGQCFRVQYYAGSVGSANITHYGRLAF